MGADLYVYDKYVKMHKLYEKYYKTKDEKYLKMAEEMFAEMVRNNEYFRDSYTPCNLMSNLGLSYLWLLEFVEKERYISPENCKKILEVVERRKVWGYIEEKRKRFIEFLRKCIDGGGMYASI